MSSRKLDEMSDIVACVYHLREASKCIEDKMPELSLAVLETAKAVVDLNSKMPVEDALREFKEVVDEIREAK